MALHRIPFAIAGLAWLAVAGYGYRATRYDGAVDWEGPYLLYTLALIIGASVVVGTAAWLTRDAPRTTLLTTGLVFAGLGVVSTIVAWALPLWMLLLGLGLTLITVSAQRTERRTAGLLAAGQLVGLLVLWAGVAAEVGRRDSYGDYPAAVGIALIITAAITVLALVDLATTPERSPAPPGDIGSPVPTIQATVSHSAP
jgi:hypothetical protein